MQKEDKLGGRFCSKLFKISNKCVRLGEKRAKRAPEPKNLRRSVLPQLPLFILPRFWVFWGGDHGQIAPPPGSASGIGTPSKFLLITFSMNYHLNSETGLP